MAGKTGRCTEGTKLFLNTTTEVKENFEIVVVEVVEEEAAAEAVDVTEDFEVALFVEEDLFLEDEGHRLHLSLRINGHQITGNMTCLKAPPIRTKFKIIIRAVLPEVNELHFFKYFC